MGEEEEKQRFEKKDEDIAAWLATHRFGHVREAWYHLGVGSLEGLAIYVKDEDARQLALRSAIEVRWFHRAL